MKIKKNGKVINLTESDLKRIVKRVLVEQSVLTEGYKNFLTIKVDTLISEIKEIIDGVKLDQTISDREETVLNDVVKGLIPSWKEFLDVEFSNVGDEDSLPSMESLTQKYAKEGYPENFPQTIKSKLISLLGEYTTKR